MRCPTMVAAPSSSAMGIRERTVIIPFIRHIFTMAMTLSISASKNIRMPQPKLS